jgi:RNA polymerase sigma-70 factor (ECF subfamily)
VTIPAANRVWNPTFLKTDLVVERAQNGDMTAFGELYTLYKTPVYNLCFTLTRGVADAEDLTQEVFLQVFRKVNSFRGEAAFGSWLYRVTTNVAMMHLRKRRVEEIPIEVLELGSRALLSASTSGSRDQCDPVQRVALLRALCGLSRNRRTLILLYDLNGFTHNEVAQCLGVTATTSKARLYQARRKLREALGGTDVRTRRSLTRVHGTTATPIARPLN